MVSTMAPSSDRYRKHGVKVEALTVGVLHNWRQQSLQGYKQHLEERVVWVQGQRVWRMEGGGRGHGRVRVCVRVRRD